MHSADPGWPFHVIGAVVDAAQWVRKKAKAWARRRFAKRARMPRAVWVEVVVTCVRCDRPGACISRPEGLICSQCWGQLVRGEMGN